jgi:hypothetical protein
MRISRIFLVPILVVILAPFAFVRDGVTDAASTSEAKWPTPASSVAEEESDRPKGGLLRRRSEDVSQALRIVSRKSGNGDGAGVIELGIHPAKLSDPRMRAQSDGVLFWKITIGKNRCPDTASA